jgi:hypothetical protein
MKIRNPLVIPAKFRHAGAFKGLRRRLQDEASILDEADAWDKDVEAFELGQDVEEDAQVSRAG